MQNKWFNILFFLLCNIGSFAQELNCKVTLLHEKITGVDAQVFNTMQKSITDFMNTHKWTNEDYQPIEKIECTFLINLTANAVGGDPDAYSATMSIQASRPVYNSAYTSTLVNFVDKDIQFKYTQYNTLNFDENQVTGTDPLVSNLTALLAYYSYLIIGLDEDSYAPDGGTKEFKKAQSIVSNAPESGKSVSGWKPVEGTHNRYWLIDQFLSSRFQDVRNYWYTMHREGLDSMYNKPTEARTRILTGIKKLYQVNKENPSSILIQFIFNAKTDEFLHLLASAPKQERGQYIPLLTALDVPNAARYNSVK